MRNARRRRVLNVDITPLIDVLFMLIIFFVLTTSFLQGRVEVELPRGEGLPNSADRSVLVTVARDRSLMWGDRAVASEELFALAAASVALGQEILVAGDGEVPYGAVAELLETLRRAGLDRVGLAFQAEP